MQDSTLLKLAAMCCITLLEVTNLAVYGIDGGILATTVSIICGLAGYEVGKGIGKQYKTTKRNR